VLTDEDRERLYASMMADRIPRVRRLTALPVLSVRLHPLHPDKPDSAHAYFVRIEGRRGLVLIPVNPPNWRIVAAVLRDAGRDEDASPRLGKASVGRLMRALAEAAQEPTGGDTSHPA
jgi:hypothetical protein